MEKIVNELKEVFAFKESTEAGDIVLVLTENPQSVLYAYVAKIERDEANLREEWWRVSLQVLSFPPQKVVWILRTPQFTGQEIFTMGGDKRFIKALDFSERGDDKGSDVKKKSPGTKPKLKVVK